MFVYTFWEPRENIPFYLRLCMETWKSFLPNATIVVLDFKNIGEFIDVRELGLNLFSKRLRLSHVSDAIRVALLAKHGGIWLDVDTIILSPNVEKYFLPDKKHRTIFFGSTTEHWPHIAFINTPPAATCMNLWREFIKEQLWNLNPSTEIKGDFLGNKFIDEYPKNFPNEIKIFDNHLVMPELDTISDFSLKTRLNAYVNYYFIQNHRLKDVNKELLLLHNSSTPEFFKQIPPKDFFRLDCTMVNVLADVLGITPPTRSRTRIQFAK